MGGVMVDNGWVHTLFSRLDMIRNSKDWWVRMQYIVWWHSTIYSCHWFLLPSTLHILKNHHHPQGCLSEQKRCFKITLNHLPWYFNKSWWQHHPILFLQECSMLWGIVSYVSHMKQAAKRCWCFVSVCYKNRRFDLWCLNIWYHQAKLA